MPIYKAVSGSKDSFMLFSCPKGRAKLKLTKPKSEIAMHSLFLLADKPGKLKEHEKMRSSTFFVEDHLIK